MIRFVLLIGLFNLACFSLAAQYTYRIDQSVPVEINGKAISMPWAGGINSAQISTLDLNGDGQQDLVIFERTANKVVTYLAIDKKYQYAPAYESLFPAGVDQWMLLRDLNGDGKKDIFTSDPNGIKAFINTTKPGQKLSWRPYNRGVFLLTIGFSGNVNLQMNNSDIPAIDDLDGDGDLDILVARFVGIGSLEYHKNFSVENSGKKDTLQLKRTTQTWGDFEECDCASFIFGPATSCSTGGRIAHAAGKSLLTLDLDNDGDKELLFSEENCKNLYLLTNEGSQIDAQMNSFSTFPSAKPVDLSVFPAGFYEDVTFDGLPDLVSSSNIFARTSFATLFNKTMWLYANTGTNQQPNFTFVKSNFLQDEMIDVGDNSVPAFFDVDSDGDLDMVIGSYGNEPTASFHFYENNGTKSEPSFKFVTANYLNFSSAYKGMYNLKPQFADIDSDGKIDFVFTATNQTDGITSLYYFQNKSSNGLSVEGQPLISTKRTIQLNENVLVTDVEQDGTADLLIGTATGAVEYWINLGAKGSFNYALKSAGYLGFGISTDRQNLALAVGDLNNDGKDELILGSQRGIVSIIENFRTQSAPVKANSQLIIDPNSGFSSEKKLSGRIWPVAANLFFTQNASIVVGNITGGLGLLKNEDSVTLSSEPVISLYPNPVLQTESLKIQVDRPMSVQVVSLQGQKLSDLLSVAANQINSFSVSHLAAGLYIATFTTNNQKIYKKFIVH
jgi:hypothetical protein